MPQAFINIIIFIRTDSDSEREREREREKSWYKKVKIYALLNKIK